MMDDSESSELLSETDLDDPKTRDMREVEAAAAEAAQIGGSVGEPDLDDELDLDPAQRAVIEGGGGESEGFEQTERTLIEHASHGDQQSAHSILHDRGAAEEENSRREDSESDGVRSS
jgi:hypothetical protein